jgi:putative ABC transport system ATP-binding protein
MTTNDVVVEAIALTRSYQIGGRHVRALQKASLTVTRGEIVAIMGPSGSGKSTLLYLLGGLEEPEEGSALIRGVDWRTLRGGARAEFRRRNCGFITQSLALLPQATTAENVETPLLLAGVDSATRTRRVTEAIERVGLSDSMAKLPDQLSGGQQQRAAIARALVTEPTVVLADEPTGNLDSANAQAITRLLIDVARDKQAAVVLVTHDSTVAKHADRIVRLHSGHLGDGNSLKPRQEGES